MGKSTGFMEHRREDIAYRPVAERVEDFFEVDVPHPEETLVRQASRCMECGIPFCHTGCPVHNRIPEFNDLVVRGKWREASENLHSTNNFPEITGRVCPRNWPSPSSVRSIAAIATRRTRIRESVSGYRSRADWPETWEATSPWRTPPTEERAFVSRSRCLPRLSVLPSF